MGFWLLNFFWIFSKISSLFLTNIFENNSRPLDCEIFYFFYTVLIGIDLFFFTSTSLWFSSKNRLFVLVLSKLDVGAINVKSEGSKSYILLRLFSILWVDAYVLMLSFLDLYNLLTLIKAWFSWFDSIECYSNLMWFSFGKYLLKTFFFFRITLNRCCIFSLRWGGSPFALNVIFLKNLLEYYLMGTNALFISLFLSWSTFLGCSADILRGNSCSVSWLKKVWENYSGKVWFSAI